MINKIILSRYKCKIILVYYNSNYKNILLRYISTFIY